jgi:type IV pilus assembly protein PilO
MGIMERLEAIPVLYRWLMVLGLLVLLTVLYWYLLYQPRLEDIAALQNQIDDRGMLLKKNQRIAKNHEKFQAEVVALQAELVRLLRFLPKSQEIPGLIRQISDLAVRTGLQVNLLRPALTEVPKQFYAEVPITVQVKGQYHAVGQFFDALARLPRIISIGDISMKGASQETQTQALATTYRYIEEEEGHEAASTDQKRHDRRR